MFFRDTSIYLKFVAITLILFVNIPANAGPYTDALGKKMVSSTTKLEKNLFIRWIFSLMSLHPELNDLSKIDNKQRKEINRNVSKIIIRLISNDCIEEARDAINYEGEGSINEALKILSQASVVELMSNEKVKTGSSVFGEIFNVELQKTEAPDNDLYLETTKAINKIRTAVPTEVREPHEILAYLRYISIRKDIKLLGMLDPVDPMATDGAAYWFNSHAGDINLALSAEEITQFGLQDMQKLGFISTVARADLQNKIDILSKYPPPSGFKPVLPAGMAGLDVNLLDFPQTIPSSVFAKDVRPDIEKHRRALFRAGLWRLLKGIPTELWGHIRVIETRKDPSNQRVWGVFLGLSDTGIAEADGKPIIDLALFKKDDGTWGLSYWQYRKQPRWLGKVVEAIKQVEFQD